MQKTEEQTRRPFHETIVEAISRAPSDDLACLAKLIIATKVPKGHDEIITAWKKRTVFFIDTFGVSASLLEQKQASAKKPEGEKKGINLDDLQQETEKLLALLNDRQPGLMSWNEFVQERLQNLYKLTSQALDK